MYVPTKTIEFGLHCKWFSCPLFTCYTSFIFTISQYVTDLLTELMKCNSIIFQYDKIWNEQIFAQMLDGNGNSTELVIHEVGT